MSGPNALSPFLMSPAERRAELCRLLALGLIRLLQRQSSELSDDIGECSLHFPPVASGSPDAKHGRPA